MCNLYHLAPRDHVERHFRTLLPDGYREAVVGPYGDGLIVRSAAGGLQALMAQWGMIAPGSRARRPESRAILTNNARAESIADRPTYRDAWRQGRRCLIPCAWYQEPNWETGRNIWWRLRRADGQPWALGGIWSTWTDPASGEIVPSYSMITVNCDGHPLLARLHKPDARLAADAQDKRSVVALEPEQWSAWLGGSQEQARALLQAPALSVIDLSVADETDRALAAARAGRPPAA